MRCPPRPRRETARRNRGLDRNRRWPGAGVIQRFLIPGSQDRIALPCHLQGDRIAGHWLTDDLGDICGRLRKALSRPQPARTGQQDQLPAAPGQSPTPQQDRKIPFGDGLDNISFHRESNPATPTSSSSQTA